MDAVALLQQSIEKNQQAVQALADQVVGMGKQITDNVKGDFDEKFTELNKNQAALQTELNSLRQTISQQNVVENNSNDKAKDIVDILLEKNASQKVKSVEINASIGVDIVSGGATFMGILVPKQKRFTIFDLLPVRYRRGLGYAYNQITMQNNADTVGEWQTKPKSEFSKERIELFLQKVAHYTEVSLEAEMEAEELGEDIRQIVRTYLYNGIVNRAEWLAIQGDGTSVSPYGGKQWNGLLNQATQFDDSVLPSDAIMIDRLRFAEAQVITNDGWASGIFLNNIDWAKIQTAKVNQNGTGAYIIGDPANGSTAKMLWGLPVVDIAAVPAGQFIVGAFADGAAEVVLQRRGVIHIEGLKGDDLINNEFTMVAELFGNIAVREPQKVVKGTFA